MEININALNQLLKDRFDNNQAKMARVLGVSRYQLNTIINKNGKSAGKKIIAAILKYCDINEIDYHEYIFLV